ncbi:MAG: hypothetical protein ACLFP1_05050 [Candidatus Goldiibacteriota bacterium]
MKKLKFKFNLKILLAILGFSLLLAGCASFEKGEGKILSFKLTPETGFRPGVVVSAVVKTTGDIKKVYGTIEVPGAFKLPLKYDKEKDVWFFKMMIPLNMQIPKGTYTARIEAVSEDGKTYAETTTIEAD